MAFEINQGWLQGIKHCFSPNFNQRPNIADINLLVIHSISLPPGEYGNTFIDDFFCNRLSTNAHPYFKTIEGVEVSAHLVIRRDGLVTQYVNFLERAWHAGASNFQGRENCNDFSIGIELEGLEGEYFEKAQYQSLVQLSACLMQEYPLINPDRICGHSDIAPQRKQDPGNGFDWQYFFTALQVQQLSSN